MKIASKLSGITLASAAAAILLSGCSTGGDYSAAAPTMAKAADVKCSGINSCKGTGACGGANNSCAGQNSCKGKGWVKANKADCVAQGGKVLSGKV